MGTDKMAVRILINEPDYKNIQDVVKKIHDVSSSDIFENGKLKGFREYLIKQNILTSNKGIDQIDRHNLSDFLDRNAFVNEEIGFKIDFPERFPKEVNYDWATVLVKPFIEFKPDFLLFYDSRLKSIVKERFNLLGHKIQYMFGSPQNTAVGGLNGLYCHDKDGQVRYEFTMNGDKSIKGKTGLLLSTYLNKQETIGFMRAAKNAGGDMIGACALFSVDGFKPNYAITLEDLTTE